MLFEEAGPPALRRARFRGFRRLRCERRFFRHRKRGGKGRVGGRVGERGGQRGGEQPRRFGRRGDRFRQGERSRFRFRRGNDSDRVGGGQRFRRDRLRAGPRAGFRRGQPLQAPRTRVELSQHQVGGVAVDLRAIHERPHLALRGADAVEVVGEAAVEVQAAQRAVVVALLGVRAARRAVPVRPRGAGHESKRVARAEEGAEDRGPGQPDEVADDRDNDHSEREPAQQFHADARRNPAAGSTWFAVPRPARADTGSHAQGYRGAGDYSRP